MAPVRVLIINPNTNISMTESLRPGVESLGYSNSQAAFTYWTCPKGEGSYNSINSARDSTNSADICFPHLQPLVPFHDCFLVACYSRHPLVGMLREECKVVQKEATKGQEGKGARKYVLGILEASLSMSLALMSPLKKENQTTWLDINGTGGAQSIREAFGIVSTGHFWEDELAGAAREFLGEKSSFLVDPGPFAGCTTTGLSADELHRLDPGAVNDRMKHATKKLVKEGQEHNKDVRVVCLGCAGMAGLEEVVREAYVEELGEEKGGLVHVIDGVKAGVSMLIGMARGGF